MIASVNGHLGSGKTLFLTYLANITDKKTPIYSNFHIELPNANFIEISDLESIKEGLLLLDEAYLWLDSRCSSKEINRYLSYLIFQSRKRGFNVFASAQINESIDLRFRFVTDLNIYAMGEQPDNDFMYVLLGFGNTKTVFLPYRIALKLFKIYDTLEYPEADTPSVFEPKKLNKIVDKTVEKIIEEYGIINKITKGMIGDIMLEDNCYDEHLIDLVFNRIKRKELMAEKEVN